MIGNIGEGRMRNESRGKRSMFSSLRKVRQGKGIEE
jgi:hypothetical protein